MENIHFHIQEHFIKELNSLPWHLELELWDPSFVNFIDFRKGLSRHPVRFVRGRRYSFAIKQTSTTAASNELSNYKRLLENGIHTLLPVGFIVCEREPLEVETKIGRSYEKNDLTFLITVLEDKALPDSYLFTLPFKEQNKKIIWNAIAELFAGIHFLGIYWGDSSLANILIKFIKIKDESGRTRTELKAILADAETVEFLPEISENLRLAEIDFFFESMEWMQEDLLIGGLTQSDTVDIDEKQYFLDLYNRHFDFLIRLKQFETKTGLDSQKLFKNFRDIVAVEVIEKQISEHKWYLSEKAGGEVSTKKAAIDWFNNIYTKYIEEMKKMKIYEIFPFKTSAVFYIELMTHKYYLSEKEGKDVGIESAIKDYIQKFALKTPLLSFVRKITKILRKFIHGIQ